MNSSDFEIFLFLALTCKIEPLGSNIIPNLNFAEKIAISQFSHSAKTTLKLSLDLFMKYFGSIATAIFVETPFGL